MQEVFEETFSLCKNKNKRKKFKKEETQTPTGFVATLHPPACWHVLAMNWHCKNDSRCQMWSTRKEKSTQEAQENKITVHNSMF